MDHTRSVNSETAKQSWRKKPRRFAPKSRLGCKTCKIRRIKCDQSRPSCLKCQTTGRTCDGYIEAALTSNTQVESSHNNTTRAEENCCSHRLFTKAIVHQPKHRTAKLPGSISAHLGPLMILPVTGPGQAEAMRFFETISIQHINGYYPCDSWRKTLMSLTQTVPSVRHAAMALSLIHRNYLDHHSSYSVPQLQSLENWLESDAPLLHYNRAIQLLLGQEIGDSTEKIATTLLVCYLFICFDYLAGNYVQALKHLRGGVELLRNIDKATLSSNDTYDNTISSQPQILICHVARQIRRLDMQAVVFLVDWTPAAFEETLLSQLSPSSSAFRSLDQAADQLQILIARVMRLFYIEQQMNQMDQTTPSPSLATDIILENLESWSNLFENMLQHDRFSEMGSATCALISMLRLQHTIAWILLGSRGPGKENEFDKFLSGFQQCVALAGDVVAAHEWFSGSLKLSFTPDIGIVPVLYIIGAKCRHPLVRREVLNILRQRAVREAAWDSVVTARVVERMIEIEEGGHEREMAQGMEHIAVWQRIEGLSMHVVTGQARVKINYTFCMREGIHTEFLDM